MIDFKKGDRVIRTEPYDYYDDNGFMQKGNTYTVFDVVPSEGLCFKGSTKRYYSFHKFSLVPKNQIVAEIINDL